MTVFIGEVKKVSESTKTLFLKSLAENVNILN